MELNPKTLPVLHDLVCKHLVRDNGSAAVKHATEVLIAANKAGILRDPRDPSIEHVRNALRQAFAEEVRKQTGNPDRWANTGAISAFQYAIALCNADPAPPFKPGDRIYPLPWNAGGWCPMVMRCTRTHVYALIPELVGVDQGPSVLKIPLHGARLATDEEVRRGGGPGAVVPTDHL